MDKKNELELNWKFPKGMKPSGRTIGEVLADARKEFLEKNGRFLTEKECVLLTDEIRRELSAKGELK